MIFRFHGGTLAQATLSAHEAEKIFEFFKNLFTGKAICQVSEHLEHHAHGAPARKGLFLMPA
jgi:hypothetical protein